LFSTHSLRIGAATTLAARQVSTLDILSWGRCFLHEEKMME
jgi:hypothetical protein